jgi:hypothetical protein
MPTTPRQLTLADRWQTLPAERKKATVLGLLMAVLAVLWLWPSTDSADAATADASTANPATGDAAIRTPTAFTSPALRQWLTEPIAVGGRNLFMAAGAVAPSGQSVRDFDAHDDEEIGRIWVNLEKALARRADEKRRLDERADQARQDASLLSLEATWMGRGTDRQSGATAVINGKLVRLGDAVSPGEAIASFRLLRVEPQRVVLERWGVRIELRMPDK